MDNEYKVINPVGHPIIKDIASIEEAREWLADRIARNVEITKPKEGDTQKEYAKMREQYKIVDKDGNIVF